MKVKRVGALVYVNGFVQPIKGASGQIGPPKPEWGDTTPFEFRPPHMHIEFQGPIFE
jgi:hypothetical protein